MAFVYRAFSENPLDEECTPRRSHAFVMMQLDGNDPSVIVQHNQLAKLFESDIDTDTYTDDDHARFLDGIFEQIRGSGLVIAHFTKDTPARTMASIFFELGMASVLGKPSFIVCSGSDYQEIAGDLKGIQIFKVEHPNFETQVKNKIKSILQKRWHYQRKARRLRDKKYGQVDLELSYENHKRALLLASKAGDRETFQCEIEEIRDIDGEISDVEQREQELMSLLKEASEILKIIAPKFLDDEKIFENIDKILKRMADNRFQGGYKSPELAARYRLRRSINEFVSAFETPTE